MDSKDSLVFLCPFDICVLGGIITDFICYVDKEPTSGETVLADDFSKGFGGKGANQCIMAARLGAHCAMLGKVGNDSDGKDTLENFRTHKVETGSIKVDNDSHTGVALISVEACSGQNHIIVGQGVNKRVNQAFIQSQRKVIEASKIMLVGMEVGQDAVVEALTISKQSHGVTILNPAPVPAEFDQSLFSLADYFCPNETEAALLLGKETNAISNVEDATECVLQLRSKGARTVIVTLGKNGCVCLEEGSNTPFHVEAPTVSAIDSTGAGDAFSGSLAYFIAHHPQLSLKQKVSRSCQVASISVQSRGTQKSYPYRNELPQNIFL